MRLVDGDAIIIDLLDRGIEGVQTDDYAEFRQIVEDAPTVDAVPVCRCKDCKYGSKCLMDMIQCKVYDRLHSADWFCAGGERKGEDE